MVASAPARWCFGLAAAVCITAMLGHEALGGPRVLDPLHETSLPADVIWLHHFSWHLGSIALIAMAAMFVLAGRKVERLILAGFGTAIAVGFGGNRIVYRAQASARRWLRGGGPSVAIKRARIVKNVRQALLATPCRDHHQTHRLHL